jgi:hypothetical protein
MKEADEQESEGVLWFWKIGEMKLQFVCHSLKFMENCLE